MMPMLIYTNQRSKKKKQRKSKSFTKAQSEHRAFLAKHGIHSTGGKKPTGRSEYFSDLSVVSDCAPVSNAIPGSGFKRSVDDYKWKRDREESAEAIAAAEEKKKRIAPYTNKGSYMYVTDDTEASSLGKKV
jgi:hypothetical protein